MRFVYAFTAVALLGGCLSAPDPEIIGDPNLIGIAGPTGPDTIPAQPVWIEYLPSAAPVQSAELLAVGMDCSTGLLSTPSLAPGGMFAILPKSTHRLLVNFDGKTSRIDFQVEEGHRNAIRIGPGTILTLLEDGEPQPALPGCY